MTCQQALCACLHSGLSPVCGLPLKLRHKRQSYKDAKTTSNKDLIFTTVTLPVSSLDISSICQLNWSVNCLRFTLINAWVYISLCKLLLWVINVISYCSSVVPWQTFNHKYHEQKKRTGCDEDGGKTRLQNSSTPKLAAWRQGSKE